MLRMCPLGGRHYEDKRDEGIGQGPKTVRTGRQSRLKPFS